MFFRRWLRNTAPSAPARRPAGPRLGLDQFGDRLAPSATGLGGMFGPPPLPWGTAAATSGSTTRPACPTPGGSTETGTDTTAAVATHFAANVLSEATAGGDVKVEVVALDANNRPVPNYTVTLSSSDAAVTGLPASYTFSATDKGVKTFAVTFSSPPSSTSTTGTTTPTAPTRPTVAATDAADSTITGTSSSTGRPMGPPPGGSGGPRRGR